MRDTVMLPEYSSVLVRFGEIGIKSRQTRKRMVSMLARNIKSALDENRLSYEEVRREYGRLFVETNDAVGAARIVSRVFGVVSTSPVVVCQASLKNILEAGVSLARQTFEKNKSFAVRARRVGKHDFSSQDIREQLGEHILEKLEAYNLDVDLDTPGQSVSVEVRDNRAYLFDETIGGVGGMPTGTQGKVVCTLSTGLDSPVAAFKIMKRGCIPVFMHLDNSPYSDDGCVDVAIAQAKTLAAYIHNYEVKMYVVPHGSDLEEAVDKGPRRMTCIFCKRNMLRLAREVAIRENADAIATGEIIGEQASQTTANLKAIDSAICDPPVLRPCAGDDKTDIQRWAAEIGTYDFSREDVTCCTLPPDYPLLKANPEKVEESESDFDFSILKSEIQNAKVLILRKKRPNKK
ncbi:tRNA 4-thiouridine(8) synthase ThiI [Candidatus Thorarchaeota archaeon]|nr:MAG: tRNA 4-thiouridine(8) synthase ThiI [Candidatus Thorarchaeota archaeon]